MSQFSGLLRVPGWTQQQPRARPFARPIMLTLQSLIVAATVGALAGTHAAIWGMYKDSIYQGFAAGRLVGSVAAGVIVSIGLASALRLPLPGPAALILLFGLTYAAHRGIYQSWRMLVRPRDQPSLVVPRSLSIAGVPVANRVARIASGIIVLMTLGLFLIALAELDRRASGPPTLASSALAGLVAGTIVAAGGAWKNAPTDGFQTMRFIRSPSMTIPFALLLSFLTESYPCLALAAIGYERAAVETWKIFCAHIAGRLRDGPWA